MKSIENTFELKRDAVIASPSTIFSRADVIVMLEELQAVVLNCLEEAREEKKPKTTSRLDILQAFERELEDTRYGEYIDHDSAEFNISYDNRIELSNINIDLDEITSALERAFDRVENNN